MRNRSQDIFNSPDKARVLHPYTTKKSPFVNNLRWILKNKVHSVDSRSLQDFKEKKEIELMKLNEVQIKKERNKQEADHNRSKEKQIPGRMSRFNKYNNPPPPPKSKAQIFPRYFSQANQSSIEQNSKGNQSMSN